jgi:ABC-type dipeptide/oligopeptide/nickel transport system permease component
MAPAALIALLTPVVVGLSWRQGREASSLAEGLAFLPVYLPAAGLLVVSLWLDPGQRGLITRFLACAALALPAACILAAQAARATAEHLGSSFVRTQRACGWHEHRIRLWLLKNLLYRLLPTLEKAWAAMFVALVFVETLFGLSGVGTLAARAIRRSDVPMTLAVVLTAAAGVVALRALATILVPTERRA